MLGQKPSKKNRDNRGRSQLFLLAVVGGGRSHCIAVERVCWFAVKLAFALQGLAHVFKREAVRGPRTLLTQVVGWAGSPMGLGGDER